MFRVPGTVHRSPLKATQEEEKKMTESKDKKTEFTGCCPGWDFQFPMGKAEEMSEMMKNFCGEGGAFDCSAMMEKFRSEDGSIDCSKMMEAMKELMSKDK
jgi:hypothetical protein